MLRTSDFDFDLSQELIAKHPVSPRDLARMLVWKNNKIVDKKVNDLVDFFDSGDVLVLNDTKVIKAKLVGKRDYTKIEINLHKRILLDGFLCEASIWQVFAKPAKKLKIGDRFIVGEDFFADVLNKNEDGTVDLHFNIAGKKFFLALEKYGQMPLPSYIKRQEILKEDDQNYQTVFAKNYGAMAAPTAGLHFTNELLQELENKGVKKVFTTLNVGAGTFLPVKSKYVSDHQIHSEYFSISDHSCDVINEAKKSGKRIISVGTTSLRVLESVVSENGLLMPQARETSIFMGS